MKNKLKIKENYPLAELTTMHVGGPAKYLIEVNSSEEIPLAIKWAKNKNMDFFILGGGSNVIVSDGGFDGVIIFINTKGREVVSRDNDNIKLKLAAGEVWDEVVKYAVGQGWWGVENLSAIPGSSGAVAVQNVGAYGVEAEDVLDKVEVYDIEQDQFKALDNKSCNFKYRYSVFKGEQRGKYVIVNIFLNLHKKGQLNADYKDVEEYFRKKNIAQPSLEQIRQAIISVRESKLPDWNVNGNCGSMFLNQVLGEVEYKKLKAKIKKNFSQQELEKLEYFKEYFWTKSGIKIPSAWLIDICGLKGKQIGRAQSYKNMPLVIINLDNQAKTKDILELIKLIRRVVFDKTGVVLDPEPNLVGFTNEEVNYYFKLN